MIDLFIMRTYLKLIFILVATLCLSGCAKEKSYKIGVSQCSQDDWRAKMNDEMLREMMLHEDAEIEIRSADDSNEKQIEDIRYFVENDFDIIIVAPNEAAALTPVIEEVYNKGVPVIIFDRNINSDTYTARIGVDDEGLGKSAAHYARHIIPGEMRAIEIYGLRGSTPAEGRHNGFSNEFLSNGGNLLASEPGDWNKEDAERVADSLLAKYKDVNLIFAHNDRMAIGAAEVARKLGRDSIKIIGIDAAPNIGIAAVADGTIDATFLYPTQGHRIVRTALQILRGENYEKETILPVSSAVDKSNADILLLQNETLKEETTKMRELKKRIDEYWIQHSSQTSLFYACIVILILLSGVLFLLLRSFWQHKRHQQALVVKNKQLEEERDKQKELNVKLEEATQSKLAFFTNVSHDLRTPLTLISEPVSQLVNAENLTPQQHSLMEIADKNVRVLHRLINQILDFRKYENGKLNLHLVEFDFSSAVEDWMESFLEIARKRDMKLRLEKPDKKDFPASMALDPEKMERVFFNLVSNAFKYTPDNGEITISYTCKDNQLILRVADTGEGIAERDLGNIFERFFQVDRVHPNGSGIGLSLVKAFVELHGGNISVESEVNKGTVFTIAIPVAHVSSATEDIEKRIDSSDVNKELAVVETDVSFDKEKPVLLVIDDNKDIRQMLVDLLNEDYNVLTSPNGADGIKKGVKYVPDLIICDVMMPGMDGLEVCRRLKKEVVTSHIPVLMLTACSLDEQRVQGYESGADGYLSKPFSIKVLKSRCASLIANRNLIRELWKNPVEQKVETSKRDTPVEPKVKSMEIENAFYSRFLEIFNEDMGNAELTVDNIAAKMGLERTQFYRKIKALTNYSPVELMRRLRLQRARNLVTSTERTISEIGYEVGFSTPAYFTKCYREAYGETPTETRTKLS